MKRTIFKVIKAFGYEVKSLQRKPLKKASFDNFDLEIYKQNYEQDSLEKKLFYNIGAGNFYHPYWTNVDFKSEWYSTNEETSLSGIHFDLMSLKNLPIDSDSAELVYSSHT